MAKESEVIELNTPCPPFELKGVDNKLHSLSSYKESKVLVVGITCNHCPYVQAYESRLMSLVAELKSQPVSFVCINANDSTAYPEDSFEEMQSRARRLQFNFDYLRDETQKVARDFKAACTPEFYVYDQSRKLRYHGRLDDSPKDPTQIKNHFLKSAILALLSDKAPEPAQTSAIGCSIKWKV